jgi:hypothetical protein
MRTVTSTSPSRSYWPVFGGCRFLGRDLIVPLITLSIVTGFGISELTARSGIAPSDGTVSRILKGDPLPLAVRTLPSAPHRPRQTNTPLEKEPGSRLPVGCESLVSAFTHSQLARIAGRCVS